MTRLPTESRDYTGLEGTGYESYRVGPNCSVPGCRRLADHSHHIVRRSELGGPFLWVRMPDGAEVGNLTALCYQHHQLVTENKARVIYEDGGRFLWMDEKGETALLIPQPPVKDHEPPVVQDDVVADEMPVRTYNVSDGAFAPVDHSDPEHERDICPTCKRKLPKPKIETEPEEKKPRGTWAVAVPMDERENGADTLDELLEAARDELDKVGISYSDGSNVKFYPLSAALALFVQHAAKILSDE